MVVEVTRCRGIASDPYGNVVLVGGTGSDDFPVHNAFQQQHVAGNGSGVLVKLDSLGQRIWATYFGGTG
jgi:hypothetical protein